MENFENNFQSPMPEVKKSEKLTREDVIGRIKKNENLENCNLLGLDLSGLNFEGKNFRGSDIRGVNLYDQTKKEGANIKNADFTDTVISDYSLDTIFARVNAEGATFGFTENLDVKRKRQREAGKIPQPEDFSGFFNFVGTAGNFKKTKWLNADFGGGSGCEALFPMADLSEAEISCCDLNQIDFSETKIDKIKIIDPVTLEGMQIAASQIETIVQSIQLTNKAAQAEFLKEVKEKGPQKALEDFFEIAVIEIKD
ncbi:MAG: pentapeptide repeat-containing protein [Patescibacteria group bacterium]